MNEDLIYKIIKHGKCYDGKEDEIRVKCPECGYVFKYPKSNLKDETSVGSYIECMKCQCNFMITLKPEATPKPD